MVKEKQIKFSYDMSNIWDYEVLTRGNKWMDLNIEKEITSIIKNQGFYAAVNSTSVWNKVSTLMFSTPVVVHNGSIKFMIPDTSGYLNRESEFMSSIGEAISTFHPKDFDRSLFPSNTVFNVSTGGISGLEISQSIEPLKANIAYNLIVLFIILNIAI